MTNIPSHTGLYNNLLTSLARTRHSVHLIV